MFTDINEKLAQARDQERQRERLQNRLEEARKRLAVEQNNQQRLAEQFRKEQRDVERLEGLSLAGIFRTLLGSKEQQLDQERQEALAAQLAYQRSQYTVSSLDREVGDLHREVSALPDLQARISDLEAQREKAILATGGENAQRLGQLSDQVMTVRRQLKEIQEAIQAGDVALRGLDQVIHSLSSAENWGTWDMLGGGLLATAAKHSRIDEARDQALEVQQQLRRFQHELGDVQQVESNMTVDLGNFERFADYFFDDLISDWIVQSKIQSSLDSTWKVHSQVKNLLTRLERDRVASQRTLTGLEAEKQAFLDHLAA